MDAPVPPGRRRFSMALAATALGAVAPVVAQVKRPAGVAWVSPEAANPSATDLVNFRRGMADLRWVEGRDYAIAPWPAPPSPEKLRAIVPSILASRPDVVVARGGPVARVMREEGAALPVVFTTSADPVISGLVPGLARPGGNFTGITYFLAELMVKRMEIMREIKPGFRRLGIFGWSKHAGETIEVRSALDAAKRLGIEATYRPADSAEEIDANYAAFAAWNADFALAFADTVTIAHAERMAELSRRHRIPTAAGWALFVMRGNLFSYGPNIEASYGRLAYFVDRILKGANPGDLPVERPTVHEFVVNRGAARELGVSFPPTVLARANQFIG